MILDLNAVERKHKNVKAVNTDRVYANTALALLSKLFITLARLTKSHNRISKVSLGYYLDGGRR